MTTSLNANDMNCLLNTPVDSRSNRNVEMYRRQMRYYVNLYNNQDDGDGNDDDDDQNSVVKKVDNDHFDENDKENISAISGVSVIKETPIVKKPSRKLSSFSIPNQAFSERIAAAPIERTPLQPVQPLETIFEANMNIAETNKEPVIHRRKSTVSKNSKDVKFLINGQKYEVVQKLGFGGSSTVFECIDVNTRKAVAIKAIKVNHNSSFLDEANLLRKLQGNEYIIKIFDFEQHDDHLFVVLEKGECDLSRILKKSDAKKPLPVPSILFYWYQMLKAVQFIHANGIIHSDLKPSNFLLVEGVLKLIDFGIASVLPSDMTSVVKNELIGTFSYISPEAIMDSRNSVDEFSPSSKPKYKVNFKSDVWSLGCILYQMIYKKSPFQHIGNIQAKIMVIINRNHEIEYKTIQKEYDYYVKISRKCLIYDYKERVSVDELLRSLEKRLIW